MMCARNWLWILTAALTCGGCASQQAEALTKLPFHVAVLPVTMQRKEQSSEVEKDGIVSLRLGEVPTRSSDEGGDEDPVPQTLEQILADSMSSTFTLASNLATSSQDEAAGSSSLSELPELSTEQWRHFQLADAAGADLLLECHLTYEDEVQHGVNSIFWMGLPFFFFGLNSGWFVDDRSYSPKGRFVCNLYDINPIRQGRAGFDERSRVLSETIALPEIDLSLLDRSTFSDNKVDYLLTLLIPAGMLGRSGPAVDETLRSHLLEDLSDLLVDSIQSRDEEVMFAENIAGFRLDRSEHFVAQKVSEETGSLDLTIAFESSHSADRLHQRAWVDGREVDVVEIMDADSANEDGKPADVSAPNQRRYRLVTEFPLATPSDEKPVVKLTLAEDARNRNSRTFTVALQPLPRAKTNVATAKTRFGVGPARGR